MFKKLILKSPKSTKLENNGGSICSSSQCKAYSPVVHFYVVVEEASNFYRQYCPGTIGVPYSLLVLMW